MGKKIPTDLLGLPEYIDQINRALTASTADCPEAIKLLVKNTIGRGKRLRPVLVVLAAECVPKKANHAVFKAAAAVELLHKASILHDSVVDSHNLSSQNPLTVLAGDYLLATSLKLAVELDPKIALELLETMGKMITGESIQLDTHYVRSPTRGSYLSSTTNKSASLFESAGAIGGLVGGCIDLQINMLRGYGHNFGIAFQILDDIQDQEVDDVKKALNSVNKYIQLAEQSLGELRDSKTKKILLQLPSIYMRQVIS
jgi:heptaprenyl diphosphate synthase